MAPKKRLNILFADDGSQHAQAAVEFLKDIPLTRNSRISVVHAFTSGQVPHITEYENMLERTSEQLSSRHLQVETELKLGPAAEMIIERQRRRDPGPGDDADRPAKRPARVAEPAGEHRAGAARIHGYRRPRRNLAR